MKIPWGNGNMPSGYHGQRSPSNQARHIFPGLCPDENYVINSIFYVVLGPWLGACKTLEKLAQARCQAIPLIMKGMRGRSLLRIMLMVVLLAGCATRYQSTSEYALVQREDSSVREAESTTVLILIDGLSQSIMAALQERGEVPNLAAFFPFKQMAHTVFPTLTYPAISSWLTTTTVDQHGVVGNSLLHGDDEWDLASIQGKHFIEKVLEDKTVFELMKNRHRPTANFSHYFGEQATASFRISLSSSLDYYLEKYRAVDQRLLDGSAHLLQKTEKKLWPGFIFVHLVGYDALAHKTGPDSAAAQDYLRWLDRQILPLLNILQEGEAQGREVRVIFSADHGLINVTQTIDLRKKLEPLEKKLKFFNQGRLASFYFAKDFSTQDFERWQQLWQDTPTSLLAFRRGDSLLIKRGEEESNYHYRPGECPGANYQVSLNLEDGEMTFCPHELTDFSASNTLERQTLHDLVRFFAAPNHPDAIALASDGQSFEKEVKGDHGGITREEYEIPLWSRNIPLSNDSEEFYVPRLLGFLRDTTSIPSKTKKSLVLNLETQGRSFNIEERLSHRQHHPFLRSTGIGMDHQFFFSRYLGMGFTGKVDYVAAQGAQLTEHYQTMASLGLVGRYFTLSRWMAGLTWQDKWRRGNATEDPLKLKKYGLLAVQLYREQFISALSRGDLVLCFDSRLWPKTKRGDVDIESGLESLFYLQWRKFEKGKNTWALSLGPQFSVENNSWDHQYIVGGQVRFSYAWGY
jgi:hypothetical protein